MRPAVVLLVALTGCQVLWPLDDIPPDPPPMVTGTYHHRVALNGLGNDVTVVDIAATDATIQIRHDDGELVEVEIAADGRFAFERQTERYAVISSLEDNQELVETSDTLVLVNFEAGRSDALPVTEPTQILLPPLVPAMDGRSVATVGQWASLILDAAQQLEWKGLAGTGDRPLGLLDSREHDAVYVLQFTDDVYSPNQRAVRTAARVDDVVMANDGTPVDLRNVQLPPDHGSDSCATFDFQLEPDIAGLQAALPGFADLTSSFGVLAVPSSATSLSGAASIVLPTADAPPFDITTDLEVRSYNPFAGHVSVLSTFSLISRTVSIPDTPALGLGATYSTLIQIPEGAACPNPVEVKPIAPAYAVDFTFNGTPMNRDDIPVDIARPGEAVIAWTAEGAVDFFDVVLLEVIVLNGKLALDPRRTFRTREREVRIPDTLLASGRRYVLRVSTLNGIPNAEDGDYATLQYPITNASTVSVPFMLP